jgi:HEPN domain-containing protein
MDEAKLKKLGAPVSDLDHSAQARLDDAEALLLANRYASAVVHALYALEIKLKAVICRRLDVTALPVIFQTHDLEALLLHAGLFHKIRRVKRPRGVFTNWDDLLITSMRKEVREARYSPHPILGRELATDPPSASRRPQRSAPMARQTEVDRAALKFASVVHDYARSRNWKTEDYAIFMYVNYDVAALHIHVLARVFETCTQEQKQDHFDNLMDEFEAKVRREDNPFNYYGLVLSGFEPPGEWADKFVFSPAEEWIDEALVNEGRTWDLHGNPVL